MDLVTDVTVALGIILVGLAAWRAPGHLVAGFVLLIGGVVVAMSGLVVRRWGTRLRRRQGRRA